MSERPAALERHNSLDSLVEDSFIGRGKLVARRRSSGKKQASLKKTQTSSLQAAQASIEKRLRAFDERFLAKQGHLPTEAIRSQLSGCLRTLQRRRSHREVDWGTGATRDDTRARPGRSSILLERRKLQGRPLHSQARASTPRGSGGALARAQTYAAS